MNYHRKQGNRKTVQRMLVVGLGMLCLVPSAAINITVRLEQEAGIGPILVAIFAVALAAFALIGADKAWNNRNIGAFFLMLFMFVGLFTFNIFNAIGLSSATRDSVTAPRQTAMETVTRLKTQLSSLSSQRQEFAKVAGNDTPEMINAEIREYQLQNQRIWIRTNHCGTGKRDITRADSARFCGNLAKMKAKLAAAIKVSEIDADIKSVQKGLGSIAVHNTESDPFVAGVTSVANVFVNLGETGEKKVSVAYDLSFGMAAEIISNFGPWALVYFLWPVAAPGTRRKLKAAKQKVEAVDIGGQIEQFMDHAVMTKHGSNIQAGVLYRSYKNWCDKEGIEVANQTAFGKKLTELGFEKNKIRSNVFYLNIQIKEVLKAVV